MNNALQGAVQEEIATRDELDAMVLRFKAAVRRGNVAQMTKRAEEARDALQAHLDAISSTWAVTKRDFGA